MKKVVKNSFCLLLIISMIFTLVNISSIETEASTNDVLGLRDGDIYYIKNSLTGRYLDAKGAVNANRTSVITCAFNGNTNQQWKLIRNPDGTYQFEAVFTINSGKKVLDRGGPNNPNNNVLSTQLYDPGYPNDQNFRITRQSDGTGTYTIQNNHYNEFIHEAGVFSGADYRVRFATGSPANRFWTFERVLKTSGDIHSFKFLLYDSSGSDSSFMNSAYSMGYASGAHNNSRRDYAFFWLQRQCIFVHNGRGNVGVIDFNEICGNLDGDIKISDVNSLPRNQLADLRVFVTTASYAGSTIAGGTPSNANHNLITAIYERGASFAIGWTGEVITSRGSAWINNFFEELNRGKTVKQSIDYADVMAYVGISNYRGDVYQKLK